MDVAARQSTVGWEAASAAVRAAVAHAQSVGASVNAAVVDRAGQLVSFLRMPGAPLHSVDIAIDKAYTAASRLSACAEMSANGKMAGVSADNA